MNSSTIVSTISTEAISRIGDPNETLRNIIEDAVSRAFAEGMDAVNRAVTAALGQREIASETAS